MKRLRVALDARKLRDFGIPDLLRGLLGAAAAGRHDLVAIVEDRGRVLLPSGVEAVPCDAAGYSLAELVTVRRALSRAQCDVFRPRTTSCRSSRPGPPW